MEVFWTGFLRVHHGFFPISAIPRLTDVKIYHEIAFPSSRKTDAVIPVPYFAAVGQGVPGAGAPWGPRKEQEGGGLKGKG
jgi:hypothetical protein